MIDFLRFDKFEKIETFTSVTIKIVALIPVACKGTSGGTVGDNACRDKDYLIHDYIPTMAARMLEML